MTVLIIILAVAAAAAVVAALMILLKGNRPAQSEEHSVIGGEGIYNVKSGDLGSGDEKWVPAPDNKATFLVQDKKHLRHAADLGIQLTLTDLYTGQMWHERVRDYLFIGRERNPNVGSQVVITGDDMISKLHCIIFAQNGLLYIQDYNSRNHTYLEGNQVSAETYMPSGSRIRIGNTQLYAEYH